MGPKGGTLRVAGTAEVAARLLLAMGKRGSSESSETRVAPGPMRPLRAEGPSSSGPPPASAATGTVTVEELEARPFQLPITVGSPARSGHRGACAFPVWARPTSLATPVYERA